MKAVQLSNVELEFLKQGLVLLINSQLKSEIHSGKEGKEWVEQFTQKKQTLDKLKRSLEETETFTNYKALTSMEINELQKELEKIIKWSTVTNRRTVAQTNYIGEWLNEERKDEL